MIEPDKLVLPALAALLLVTMLGAPVFTAIGGAALILFWGGQSAHRHDAAQASFAGHEPVAAQDPVVHAGGIFSRGKRRVPAAGAGFPGVVRAFRGGPAIVTALVCAFFTSFTGASGVTILALGGLLMPVLLAARYSERNSLGLLTGAGSLGLLFPPCLPVILYSIVAGTAIANSGGDLNGVTMEKMFLGGLLPGCCWWR